MMTGQIELPSDGVITRAAFAELPTPSPGWAWELRSGRLELTYMPVTFWHWQVILVVLEYWRRRRRGHEVAGEQYVADPGFVRGGSGRNNYVADGVVFQAGHRPSPRESTHDAAILHAVIGAVSNNSEEQDATHKLRVYAKLGIEHYWIIRGDVNAEAVDGVVTQYDLVDGEYEVVGQRLISQLRDA
jgi:Uma2 family endonuclease